LCVSSFQIKTTSTGEKISHNIFLVKEEKKSEHDVFFQKERLKANSRKFQEKGVPISSLPTVTKCLPSKPYKCTDTQIFRRQDVLREYGFVNGFVKQYVYSEEDPFYKRYN